MPTDLILSAHRSAWSVAHNHGTSWDKNKYMVRVRDKIWKRDDYTCQACGWRSEQFQEVHHRDHNHRNFKEANLETLCPLCHQVFHLPTAGATNGGSIIWMPEMTQKEINLLCIGIFSTMRNPKNQWAGIARTLYGALEARKAWMDENLSRADPGILGQMLLSLTPEEYENRQSWLQHLRLLPASSRFEEAAEYWYAAFFKSVPEDQWGKGLEDVNLGDLLESMGDKLLKR